MPTVLCAECGKAAPCPDGHYAVVDIAGTQIDWIKKLPETSWIPALNLLNELIGIEASYTNTNENDVQFGYRPYPLGTFGSLLMTARANVQQGNWARPRFLEVGCGPGTKLVLANKVFGLEVSGFDVDAQYIKDAADLLVSQTLIDFQVRVDDAEDFDDYGLFDIVFLNRPLRDYDRQLQLEQHVMSRMGNGAVLILANSLTHPPYWKCLQQAVACSVYQKTCRCYEAESYLTFPGDQANLVSCKLCGRVLWATGPS
ncbi:MAG: class I SAM-dependent methyltransferase [Candidatus Binataceae bacterium]|jgi:SAM-dependent methyltransferase